MSGRCLFRIGLALGAVIVAGLNVLIFLPRSELSDLPYSNSDGISLTLDLDLPHSSSTPHPIILFAPPDGDWPREFKQEPRFRRLLDLLTKHGYAVATIHYRDFSHDHRFPAPVEDGKAAVRWLRANAARYGLDARFIGAMGISQGGWGVSMLGTTSPEHGFEGDGNLEQSSRVQAVVGLGVPGDFAATALTGRMEYNYLRPFLGAGPSDNPGLYERASPGSYASPDDPPFLLFHSSEDLVVPVAMAQTFANRLRQGGVSVTFVEDGGMDHIWDGQKLDRLLDQTLHFFDQHLRP